mmetsp:Transcript_11764/g.38947  ORF Transcript_11764/g.38947 Transcript_11764/m.38947 type:complete len:210 (+) Transcript_11764:1473-2102(+)
MAPAPPTREVGSAEAALTADAPLLAAACRPPFAASPPPPSPPSSPCPIWYTCAGLSIRREAPALLTSARWPSSPAASAFGAQRAMRPSAPPETTPPSVARSTVTAPRCARPIVRRAAGLRGASNTKMLPLLPPTKVSPCAAPLGAAKATPPKATHESDVGRSAAPPPMRPSCDLSAQKRASAPTSAASASLRCAPDGALRGGVSVQNFG